MAVLTSQFTVDPQGQHVILTGLTVAGVNQPTYSDAGLTTPVTWPQKLTGAAVTYYIGLINAQAILSVTQLDGTALPDELIPLSSVGNPTVYPVPTLPQVAADESANSGTYVEQGSLVVSVKDHSAKGDGTTDDTTAIQAAYDLVGAAGGGIVFFPVGTYIVSGGGIILRYPNVWIRGAGPGSTVKRISGGSVSPLFITGSANVNNGRISDLTLDWNYANQSGSGTEVIGLLGYSTSLDGFVVERNVFVNIPAGITATYVSGLTVRDNTFQGAANGTGLAVSLSGSVTDSRISGNRFMFVKQGIQLSGTDNKNVSISGNHMDMGWPYLQAQATGSGGTVTYTATTLTDTAATFAAYGAYGVQVRLLVPMASNSGATVTYPSLTLTDSAATFVTAGVKVNHLIRVGTAWTTVTEVTSQTVLQVEPWRSTTTFQGVLTPASGTAYTISQPIIGLVASNTSTALTVDRWAALDGSTYSPSAGTAYEVMYAAGYPLVVSTGNTNVRVEDNDFRRSYTDMCEMQGTDYQVVGNRLELGGDLGIACVGARGVVTGNRVVYCGAAGIMGGTDVTITGNICQDNTWINNVDTNGLGDIMVDNGSARVTVTANTCVATGRTTLSRYGIAVRGNSSPVTDVTVADNTCTGYSVSGLRFYGSGTVSTVRVRDNAATFSQVGTYQWVGQGIDLNNNYQVADALPRVIAAHNATPALTSGTMYAVYFRPTQPVVVGNMQTFTMGTAASGLTLARMGLYTVDPSGAPLTLVARTASDTTIGTAGYTLYKRALDTTGGYPASYVLTPGALYAAAIIFVGTTMPTLSGNQMISGAQTNLATYGPDQIVVTQVSSLSDLPTTFSTAAGSDHLPWIALTV